MLPDVVRSFCRFKALSSQDFCLLHANLTFASNRPWAIKLSSSLILVAVFLKQFPSLPGYGSVYPWNSLRRLTTIEAISSWVVQLPTMVSAVLQTPGSALLTVCSIYATCHGPAFALEICTSRFVSSELSSTPRALTTSDLRVHLCPLVHVLPWSRV